MQTTKPKLLVLDGQGVVFDAPFKKFLLSFARSNELDYDRVKKRWKNGIRQRAWSGSIDDKTLWNELAGKSVDLDQTMLSLNASYAPGPVAGHLYEWARLVPVWLLSNHRSQWLLPQLDSLGFGSVFQKLLISDRTGLVKPEPDAFRQLLHDGAAARDILIVDDQPHNTKAAEDLGFRAILAAPKTRWVEQIEIELRRVNRGRTEVLLRETGKPGSNRS